MKITLETHEAEHKEYEAGWGWPSNSRKAHWFVDSRSLCRKWLFFGAVEVGNNDSPDNCVACRKILGKEPK